MNTQIITETLGFTEYLQSKDLSPSTKNHYLWQVHKFLQWSNKEAINCTKKDILNYLSHLKNNKNQENITRKNHLIALNHYFTFLMQNDITTTNPTAFLKIRGTRKRKLQYIYTFEQLEQIYDDYYHNYIANFDVHHIPKNQRKQSYLNRHRNQIMLGFLIYQGLATNELQKIKLTDLNTNKGQVKIRAARKSSERKIPLHAVQIGALINYIQNIRTQFFDYRSDENEQLFLPMPASGSRHTDSLNVMGIIKPLSRQVRKLDIKFVRLTQIRASVITHWIKTKGLRKAQYLAGHKSILTTEDYLPNDLESLSNDINQFNPF